MTDGTPVCYWWFHISVLMPIWTMPHRELQGVITAKNKYLNQTPNGITILAKPPLATPVVKPSYSNLTLSQKTYMSNSALLSYTCHHTLLLTAKKHSQPNKTGLDRSDYSYACCRARMQGSVAMQLGVHMFKTAIATSSQGQAVHAKCTENSCSLNNGRPKGSSLKGMAQRAAAPSQSQEGDATSAFTTIMTHSQKCYTQQLQHPLFVQSAHHPKQ